MGQFAGEAKCPIPAMILPFFFDCFMSGWIFCCLSHTFPGSLVLLNFICFPHSPFLKSSAFLLDIPLVLSLNRCYQVCLSNFHMITSISVLPSHCLILLSFSSWGTDSWGHSFSMKSISLPFTPFLFSLLLSSLQFSPFYSSISALLHQEGTG